MTSDEVKEIVGDRCTLMYLAGNLGVRFGEAKKLARDAGLLVHKNIMGDWFISTKQFEAKHPLIPRR